VTNGNIYRLSNQETPITHPFFIEDLLQSIQATDFGITIRPKAIPMAYGRYLLKVYLTSLLPFHQIIPCSAAAEEIICKPIMLALRADVWALSY
jgi:hypothetical protein